MRGNQSHPIFVCGFSLYISFSELKQCVGWHVGYPVFFWTLCVLRNSSSASVMALLGCGAVLTCRHERRNPLFLVECHSYLSREVGEKDPGIMTSEKKYCLWFSVLHYPQWQQVCKSSWMLVFLLHRTIFKLPKLLVKERFCFPGPFACMALWTSEARLQLCLRPCAGHSLTQFCCGFSVLSFTKPNYGPPVLFCDFEIMSILSCD